MTIDSKNQNSLGDDGDGDGIYIDRKRPRFAPAFTLPSDGARDVAQAHGFDHRLFDLKISVENDEPVDGDGFYTVGITGSLSTDMGDSPLAGATMGTLATIFTTMRLKLSHRKNAAANDVMEMLTAANQDDLGLSQFYEACLWYVNVQKAVESYFPEDDMQNPHPGVINRIGVFGYAKLMAPNKETYIFDAETSRLQGMTPKKFVLDMIKMMAQSGGNLALINAATGIPAHILKAHKIKK